MGDREIRSNGLHGGPGDLGDRCHVNSQLHINCCLYFSIGNRKLLKGSGRGSNNQISTLGKFLHSSQTV